MTGDRPVTVRYDLRMKRLLIASTLAVLSSCSGSPSGAPLPNPFARWEYHCLAPLTAGAACENDQACAPGLQCSPASRRCEAAGGLDNPCTTDRGCTAEFACMSKLSQAMCHTVECDANGNNCRQGQPTTTPCDTSFQCPRNLICIPGNLIGTFCAPRAAMGADCSNFAVGGCQSGLVCQIVTARCVTPPTRGEPCPMPIGGVTCGDGLVCRSDTQGNSTCELPAVIGQRCESGGGCERGAHCSLSRLVCERNVGVGDDCRNGNECGEAPFDTRIGVECVQGTCEDTSREGARCWPVEPSQCTNGRVCRKG